MKSAVKLNLVLAALSVVCLGWATTARAYLTSDGDFNNQTNNVLLVSPWTVNVMYGLTNAQSPFTNVFAANSMGAGWTNDGAGPWVLQPFSAIATNAAGLRYMNADFMIPYSGVGGYRFAIGDSAYGNGLLMVVVHSSGLFAYDGSGQGAALLTPAAGVWYNLQLTLDMDANTYSGAVVRADNSEQTLISSRSFIAEKNINQIWIDNLGGSLGNAGGRIDNWVFSTNALPAPPSFPGNVHYVAQAGQTPSGNFITWATAASNIQDAISAADIGHTVLVSNGVYDAGGTLVAGCTVTNRIYINKTITVRSANNDPANTLIKGATDNGANGPAAVRPVYMTAGSLIGFTLTNGATASGTTFDVNHVGGGVLCSSTTPVISNCLITCNQSGADGGGSYLGVLNNCTIIGNSTVAYDGGGGGGAHGGILINCTIVSNSTSLVDGYHGGGVHDAVVSNCTIVGNRAGDAGGTHNCTVYNSLIAGNYASRIAGGAVYGTLYNCTMVGNWANGANGVFAGGIWGDAGNAITLVNCIMYFNNCTAGVYPNLNTGSQAPYQHLTNTCTTGVTLSDGNITNDPTFVANGSGYGTNLVFGTYRLRGNSPCVNTGTNQDWWMTGALDLDGRQRIRYGTVDMGAYEFVRSGAILGFR